MNKPAPFKPIRMLETLIAHGVEFLLIGGLAGRMHGSPTITNDLDICYARNYANLERLAAALHQMKAKLRGAPEDVPFLLDAKTLQNGDHFTFITSDGPIDCLGTPSGTKGYEELKATAEETDIGDIRIKVVAIDDLIRMKRAAGRPKDRIELEVLGALREELERPE